jgi:glutathione synthase/RimK-type ligase-like ATP-grasp enzyme
LILKEACEKQGLAWQLVDKFSNNLAKVSDGTKNFFASNSRPGVYPLNPQFASQIVKDKAWTYKLLSQAGYQIPRGNYFFLRPEYKELRGSGQEFSDALKYAKDKYPVFVKPNDATVGRLAEIIYNEEQLILHLKEIAKISWIGIIQEVIIQPEYRIFAVDGDIQFTYKKEAPNIVGDGKSTIKELILAKEQNLDSPLLEKQLSDNRLSSDSVLEPGRKLIVSSKANISAGAQILEYKETASLATQEWVRKIMKYFSLRVCGIDVFTSSSIDNPQDFTLIEINSNPSLSGIYKLGQQEKALSIWQKILDKYFKEKSSLS